MLPSKALDKLCQEDLEGFCIHLRRGCPRSRVNARSRLQNERRLDLRELGEPLKVLFDLVMPLVWILLSSILILIKMARSQADSYPA